MLYKVKSTYFLKILFDIIDDKAKLQLIKKNKKLKNILNINLFQYRILSGKIKIYEENGKGKEYDCLDETLLFEGVYLKNERNGKGREYNYRRNIIFEGEYIKGKRNGKGKEYYNNHIIKFDGEFCNGKKWNGKGYDTSKNEIYELKNGEGKIKEYDYDGNLMLEGEYKNGELEGDVKEYYAEGNLAFEGKYSFGKRNGFGKEYHFNGRLKFEGDYFYDSKWNGKAFDESEKFLYKLEDGNGYIKNYSDNGELLSEYEYKQGSITGVGKVYFDGKVIFEGEYFKGKRNGKGKEYNAKKQIIFEGEYLYDKKKKGKA